ncbi:MFS family permease [Halanaeroarchaeum sp. HSR-CO]|uniref:MFS transporter n=1 Tax=Halanaeroarchaeum sp. HSR-CO TaxID=2866382 RepID=UPI00217E27E7|nr:MFS transporter [Halanaeroarchaeum sp. HSR-CO]UWG46442.1 MFS family permease [Halanaeroarchaeum sp. HSR-CO]
MPDEVTDGWSGPPVENRRRALAVVFAIVFVDLLGFGILIPIVPLYAEAFGASEFVVGVLIAAYSMTQFLFAPVLGRLSDERGRRPILLLSLFGSVVAWTLFGLAQGLFVLFAARLLAGAMGGNIATAHAYVADVMPPEDRAKGLGLVGAAFGLGFVFGPALGGVFSADAAVATVSDVVPAFVPITQFTLPSFVAAAISLLNLLAAAVVLPETNVGGGAATDRSRLNRLVGALENPSLRGLVVAFFLFSFAFSAMESMFVLFTRDVFGYGPSMNGYILAYLGVVIAVVQGGLVGRLADRFGERTLALVGVAIELVTLTLVPFSGVIGELVPAISPLGAVGPTISGPLLTLLVVLTGLSVGNGFTNVSLNTLVSQSAAENEQGGAFGLTQSAGSIARATGPVLAGLLYTSIAFWTPFVVGGLLMIPILVVLVRYVGVADPRPA